MATATHQSSATMDHGMPVGISRDQILGKLGVFLLITVLIITGLSQAENMLRFPYFQDAEGTNVANAYALITRGDLSPYTYAYEDPPLGTFLLAGWTAATGGFDSFGFSLNSGRVLMLGVHLLTVALIFGTAKKLSNSNLAALLAVLIFAFSPLSLAIQRRVLLDNIMVLFLVASFYFSVGSNRTLYHYLASAIFFGLAVLVKTNALWFFFAFVFSLRGQSHQHHRRFAVNLWMALAIFLVSLYPLYAQMRQELFPEGWLLGGDFPHVSLLERLADRGPETGVFLNIGSGFSDSFAQWTDVSNVTADPIIIYGGIVAMLFLLVLSSDNRSLRPLIGMALMYIVGLFLGGSVFNSSIITILPFFAIGIGIVVAALTNLVSGSTGNIVFKLASGIIVLGVILYPFWIFYSSRMEPYVVDQTGGQLEAIDWVATNLPDEATVVMDNFAFVALRRTMPNVHHYWKVDTDPDVKFSLLNDDLCNIDYLVTTPQVISDMDVYKLDLLKRTFNSSELLMTYENNGWPVQIWQVSKEFCKSSEAA